MKLSSRTGTAIAVALAFTALPAGAAMAQQADCVVVDGEGSANGDIDCPPQTGVGGETVDNEPDSVDEGDGTSVQPGRIDRPDGAPAGEEETDGAPSVESEETQLAATGTDADVALVAGLAALTLGGGALVATRRRQRTDA